MKLMEIVVAVDNLIMLFVLLGYRSTRFYEFHRFMNGTFMFIELSKSI